MIYGNRCSRHVREKNVTCNQGKIIKQTKDMTKMMD